MSDGPTDAEAGGARDGEPPPEPDRRSEGGGQDGGRRAVKGGVTRRRMLLGGGASIAGVGAAKALYNTVLGYGQLGVGTNVRQQDLGPIVSERLAPAYDGAIDGVRIRTAGSELLVDGERLRFGDDPAAAAALDSRLGLDGRLSALFADVSALRAGEYAFEFHGPSAFFERMADGESRPGVVTAVRTNWDRTVDPALVERFVGGDPADTVGVVDGLVEGFREHATYDVPRYLAGSVEDNVILGTADLRRYFEDETGFEALLGGGETGIFCWELVYRSIEALQAVPPERQSVPVAACYVIDDRHKHAFTGLLGAIRVDGDLRFPMTFLDYTHTTLYDDFRLTGVLGEGLDAYNDRHRAEDVYW